MANQRGATSAATRMASRKKWKIGEGEFVQSELQFGAKTEFLGLLMEAGDEALEKGLNVGPLLRIDPKKFDRDSLKDMDAKAFFTLVAENFETADMVTVAKEFGRLAMRIFGKVPRLLPEAYCIILDVPEEDRDDFKRGPWRRIDDDTGFGIFQLFVQQNGRLLVDFAGRWWAQVQELQSSTSSA